MPDVSYSRVNWEDSPSTNTPIDAENLNKMDKGIADCATEINNRQPKTDNTLNTTAKTIPGAINELKSDLTANNNEFIFDYDATSQSYGYKAGGADTFHPFRPNKTETQTVNKSYSGYGSLTFTMTFSTLREIVGIKSYSRSNGYIYTNSITVNGNSVTLNTQNAGSLTVNSNFTVNAVGY